MKCYYDDVSRLLQVLVDVNWRPVFWEDPNSAPQAIKPYVSKADIVKLSDEEAEWLFGLSASDALQHPYKVWLTPHYPQLSGG